MNLRTLIIAFAAAVGLSGSAQEAASPLASGRWVRIDVEQTGMQRISAAQLRAMGFSYPQRVGVFGSGGRALPERLAPENSRPISRVPALASEEGIIFYATDATSWNRASSGELPWVPSANPYSSRSSYLLGETDGQQLLPEQYEPIVTSADETKRSFTQLLLHEKDLAMAANTGSLALGEDFRSRATQSFTFELPGIVEGSDALTAVTFATLTTNGVSSLTMRANGAQLPASTADVIGAATSSDVFARTTRSVKRIEDPGNQLRLEITWNEGGAVRLARLDNIVVAYERELRLSDEALSFAIDGPASIEIEGCDADVHIWDVTDQTSPIEITYTLSGSAASFGQAASRREYVAFRTSSEMPAPKQGAVVPNQNLAGRTPPDMLIIAPAEFATTAARIAALHTSRDGMDVAIATPTQIYNEFSSATPDLGAYRRLLRHWRRSDPQKAAYVLMLGKPTSNPRNLGISDLMLAGLPEPVLIYQSSEGLSQGTSYSTDDLTAITSDATGYFDPAAAKLDVAVGRIPVETAKEADAAAAKLESYVSCPELGSWRNRVMLVADDQDAGIHLDQAEAAYSAMRAAPAGDGRAYTRLYLDAFPLSMSGTGASYPEPRRRLLAAFQEGTGIINYIGHANPTSWGHEGLLTWTDINALQNSRWPIVYASTCEFARWDDTYKSGAEKMLLSPDAGAIAIISASRTVFMSANGLLNTAIAQRMFTTETDGASRRIGDVYREGKNGCVASDDNKLRFLLMGDPALRIPGGKYGVRIDSIGQRNLAEAVAAGDLPVIAAASRVEISGSIITPDGSVAEDFDGVAEPVLFDAEIPVETLGNGDNGRKSVYNDRLNRLFSGRTAVERGRFRTTILMPPDVEQNYSPALISVYASSTDGREAAGACEDLYVYGSDPAGTDSEGPVISGFGLNGEWWAEGGASGPRPLVLAHVSDKSGINLADNSLGHSPTLLLDGRRTFADLSSSFTPDVSDPTAASLSYALPELEPGTHTLTFTVWDNANNASSADLSFVIVAGGVPSILSLTPDKSPAVSEVIFTLTHDRPAERVNVEIDIYSLEGRHVRSLSQQAANSPSISLAWDLCDSAGRRVDTGVYIYRARLTDASGATAVESGKIVVAAP